MPPASCAPPRDYRDVTFEYLTRCAAEGAVYVELTASPDHAAEAGLPYADMVAGTAQGIDDARAAAGIESRMIVTAVRNFGTERAEAIARTAAEQPHRYVTGFGLAGDEAGFPPGPFARAFEIAHAAGLGLTCHAGEWAGPESVRGALALPVPVTRLGHGVRAVEDAALVRELAERGTVLEVCPTSNVVLSAYAGYPRAPVPAAARRRRARDARLGRPAVLAGEHRRRVRGRAARVGTRRRRAARDHPHRDRGRVRPGRPENCALSANSAMSRRALH